jgi:hypothetical protein
MLAMCLCTSVCPHIHILKAEPITMKLGMYVMTPGPISTEYFMETFARKQLDLNITSKNNTHTIEEFLDSSIYVWPVLYQRKLVD